MINLPFELQELILKNQEIENYLKTKSNLLEIIPNKIDKAISNIKNPKEFYKPESLIEASKTIISALEIVSLPYAPAKIMFNEYQNPLFTPDYETMKKNVFSKSTNIFRDYYKKWIPKIKRKKPSYIGISISSNNQLVAGLTLANLLKTNTDAHVSIGGNYFTRTVETFLNHPDFFDTFADSVSIDEGEKPIVEFAKYIASQIPIEDVPNLIYKKDGKVTINSACTPLKLNKIPAPSYDGFNFKKYFSPHVVLPIQTTRGCYWGKCAFCDIPYGKKYSVKNIDELILELQEYKRKYGIAHFEIIDEAITPKYYELLADKILESGLDINYLGCGRTEPTFNQEIFNKMRKSGLRMLMWGLESGSEKILKLINKGVDCKDRFNVLKKSAEADIWNHGYLFFGFPTETLEEAKETIKMIKENTKIIHSCGSCFFNLPKHSSVRKNPEKYNITNLENTNINFATILKFEGNILSQDETDKIEKLYSETMSESYPTELWRYIITQEYLFLYISHYGIDWVKNYKFPAKK